MSIRVYGSIAQFAVGLDSRFDLLEELAGRGIAEPRLRPYFVESFGEGYRQVRV
jgi:hypothetical protein